jgi:hypothetical protein
MIASIFFMALFVLTDPSGRGRTLWVVDLRHTNRTNTQKHRGCHAHSANGANVQKPLQNRGHRLMKLFSVEIPHFHWLSFFIQQC